MMARRDTGAKASASWAELPQKVAELLDTIQVLIWLCFHGQR